MIPDKKAFYRSLPAKRMGAGALFFDKKGFLLVVEPTYKRGWEIPGGAVELNESPSAAVVREIHEELGLRTAPASLSLLALDYMAGNGDKTEALMFIFSGGVLNESRQDAIELNPQELKSFRFINPEDVSEYLISAVAERVKRAIDSMAANRVSYYEGVY